MRFPTSISRRTFLEGLGVSAAMAPFVPIVNASGAESLTPKRLLLFWTPHGTYLPAWMPSGSQTNFTLGQSLAPLAPLQSKINVIYGVGMKGGFHQQAMQLFTGTYLTDAAGGEPGDNDTPTNSSIEIPISAAIGTTTKFPNYYFGAGGGYGGVLSTVCVNNGFGIQMQGDARAAFNELFSTTSTATLADRTCVLNAVASEVKALQSKLPAADAPKMAAHLAALQAIQKQLTTQTAACTGPNFASDPTDAPTRLSVMSQMAVAAFQCDLTRVAVIQFSVDGNDGYAYTWLNQTAGHHPMTHMPPSDTLDPNGNPVTDQTLSVNGQLTGIYTWYAQQFANICSQLDAIPEGNGTMLDNTLAVWGTELAHCYTHQSGPGIPLVLAGGLGGAIRTGRWLDYSANPQDHNRLLVSILNAFGLSQYNTYGLTDVGSGPLVGF